jgi:energy-coupling factor transporter ATP-binding protein EcfA2
VRRVAFLWGASGSGKSTITSALLGPSPQVLGRWSIGAECASPGVYTRGEAVTGADKLVKAPAMWRALISPEVMVRDIPPHLPVVLDGQRFAEWAIEALHGQALRIGIVLLNSPKTLGARRRARGSPYIHEGMLAGQQRRWQTLVGRCDRGYEVDGERSLAQVVQSVRTILREP